MKCKGNAEIGIIGGTGSDIELENVEDIKVYTPYGGTSDFVKIGMFNKKKVAFLSRHRLGHDIPPHNLNNKANIWALKEL